MSKRGETSARRMRDAFGFAIELASPKSWLRHSRLTAPLGRHGHTDGQTSSFVLAGGPCEVQDAGARVLENGLVWAKIIRERIALSLVRSYLLKPIF